MTEIKPPMTADELKSGISKMANELYISVFAQYGKYIDSKVSFDENLYTLLLEQTQISFQKRVVRRLKTAGFLNVKTMNTFVMSKDFLPNLNFDELRDLTTCKFIDEKTDICAVGPAGRGKTHLALAIGYEAVCRGYSVKFRRVCDLITELREAKSTKKLNDQMRLLSRCQLLILDEFGYMNYDIESANFLYQIIGARYETGSTFYTSNLNFSEWVTFLGNDEKLAAAIATRIAHNSIVLDTNGPKDWRLEHARSRRIKTAPDTSDKSIRDSDPDATHMVDQELPVEV